MFLRDFLLDTDELTYSHLISIQSSLTCFQPGSGRASNNTRLKNLMWYDDQLEESERICLYFIFFALGCFFFAVSSSLQALFFLICRKQIKYQHSKTIDIHVVFSIYWITVSLTRYCAIKTFFNIAYKNVICSTLIDYGFLFVV